MPWNPSKFQTLAAALTLTTAVVGCAGESGEAATDGDRAGRGEQVAGSLGAPTAAFPEDFGTIQTVREMPDGKVLVADPLGGTLYLVDLDAGTRTQVGSEGQGPTEYRQPDAVWPLPGDSTLLVDLGNGRMTALAPDLSFGSTAPLSAGDPRSGLVLAIPQGVDARGNVYARSQGGMRGPGAPLPDSANVLRIARGSFRTDTVARFKIPDVVRTVSGGAGEQNVSIQQVPLSPEDAWGVAPDGSVAFARVGDYHVEWVGPDGARSAGAPLAVDRVPIGTAEKQEWLRAQGRSGGGIGVSVSVENGVMTTSFSRGGPRGEERQIDQFTWPETKPPFYGGRLPIDPLSRVWVRRHVRAGGEATYDVFDRQGSHVATYRLPSNKVVVGFGASSVYVVSYDDVDLNYLERYRLPGA